MGVKYVIQNKTETDKHDENQLRQWMCSYHNGCIRLAYEKLKKGKKKIVEQWLKPFFKVKNLMRWIEIVIQS